MTVHHTLQSLLGLASLLGLGTRPSPPPEPLDLGAAGGVGSAGPVAWTIGGSYVRATLWTAPTP